MPVDATSGASAFVGSERVRQPHSFRIDGTPEPGAIVNAARWLQARNAGLRKVMVFVNDDHTVVGGWATDGHDDQVPDIANGLHAILGGTLRFDTEVEASDTTYLEGFPEEFVHMYLRSYA